MRSKHLSEFNTLSLEVIAVLLLLSLLFSLTQMARDLYFYWKNNWDFSRDSGVRIHMGSYGPRTERNALSAKSRLAFGHPFFVIVNLVLLLPIGIELCRRGQW